MLGEIVRLINGENRMNYIIEYPLSSLIYISVITITTLLSVVVSKHSKYRSSSYLLLFIILILSLFSGLRGASVGVDTSRYIRHIYAWQKGLYNAFPTEPGLRFISILASIFIEGHVFTLVIVSLIVNGLIIIRLWKLRDNISFPFSIFIYSANYYIMTFSGIRQWLAIAIIFYASKYLIEMKYVKFSLFILVAALFHNTAIIAIVLPVLDILLNKLKDKKQRKTMFQLILIAPFIVLVGFYLEYKFSIFSQYNYYIENFKWNKSTGLVIWIRIFIGLLIYLSFNKEELVDYEFYKRIYRIYFFGLLLTVPGYYVSNISRIGLYFIIFEIILFGTIIKSNKKEKSRMFFMFIFIFTLLMFLIELAGSGRGHMPYIPFWLDNI